MSYLDEVEQRWSVVRTTWPDRIVSQKYQLFMHRKVKSFRQEGPSCGILALALAIQSLDTTNSCEPRPLFLHLLRLAKDLNLTRQGEMFDAESLCKLVIHDSDLSNTVEASVVHWTCLGDILQELTDNSVVLVPYDKDGNHEPCFKNGGKAHWCAIVGFFHPVVDDNISTSILSISSLTESVNETTDIESTFVLAFHGQSLHPAIWPLELLFQSNLQLMKAHDAVVAQARDADAFVLPTSDGDLTHALRQRFVTIRSMKPK
jgi:hypothetical protein